MRLKPSYAQSRSRQAIRWRLRPVSANGQLAFGEYRWNETSRHFVAEAVTVLTLADALIADITAFRGPACSPRLAYRTYVEP